MTIALLATMLAITQTKTVTVTSHLAHSSVVLEELGRAAGVKMVPTGSVLKDYFFLHFTDTPLDTAMARVAKTLNATWRKQEDGSYLLMRTQTQELQTGKTVSNYRDDFAVALRKEEIKPVSVEEFQAKIAEARKVEKSQDQNPWTRIQELNKFTPGDRFARRLLQSVGADVISQLPEGQPMWFAASPTRRQMPMPAGARAAFDAFVSESKTLASLLPPVDEFNGGHYVSILHGRNVDMNKPIRFAMSVTRNNSNAYATVYLEQEGTYNQYSANVSSREYKPNEVPPNGVFAGIKDKIKFSDGLLALTDAAKRATGPRLPGSPAGGDPKIWQAVFADPEGRDFTTILADDFFKQSAEAKGLDMVALVPDIITFLPVFAGVNTQIQTTVEQLWAATSQFPGGLVVEAKDGYVSVRPSNYVEGRDRLSRPAMAKMMAKLSVGSLDLDTLADFVGATESDETIMVGTMIAILASPGSSAMSRMMTLQSPDLLRLYGRLTPAQREQAKHGGLVIRIDNMPPAFAKPMDKLIFGKSQPLSEKLVDRDQANPNSWSGEMKLEMYPSFCLGNGLPPGSVARIMLGDRERLFMHRNTNYGGNDQVQSVEEAARAIAWESTPAAQSQDYYRDNAIAGFAVAQQTELFVEFEFPTVGMKREMLFLPQLASDVKFVDPSQLPAAWRDKLVPEIAKMKEQYKNVAPIRTNPPPPNG